MRIRTWLTFSLAVIASGLIPLSARAAKRVSVQDIQARCCYQEQVELIGTITHFEPSATDNTYFYYLQDDFGQPIKVTAAGKPDLKPGQRVKVIGIVSQSATDAFYIAEQTHQAEGFLGGTVSAPLFYLIIVSAVVLAILIGVIIYFLVTQSQRQEEKAAQQAAEAAARDREVQELKARLQAQEEEERRARAQAAAEKAKAKTEIKAPAAVAPAITPRYQRAFLKIIQGPEQDATLELKIPTTTIGRDETNDIVLRDDRVSGKHARIEFEGGTFFIVDVGSTNGTYLNGNKISGRVALMHGHRLRMGRVELAFIGEI